MTDKEYKEQKQRIRKLIKKWVQPLGLNWYSIEFIYERVIKPDDRQTAYSPKNVSGYWQTVMDTTADPYYCTASVTCYLPIVKDLNDRELEETFLHELMHIFLSSMHDKKSAKEEEQVATRLAKAFIWAVEEVK